MKSQRSRRAYHLTSATHALSNLRHRRLKIATFNDLNDPFELWAVGQSDKALRQALRGFKEQIAKQYGVLCFSKTWNNPVLWSHYADRHRGIALGFEINEDIIKDVTYSAKRPTWHRADLATLNTLLYTKHEDWHYEQECRVFARLEEQDPASGLYFGNFNDDLILRDVITGPLCTTTKKEVEAALHDENVTITKGRLAFNTFNVVKDQRGFRATRQPQKQ